jgi:hypothetical protein
MSFNSAPQTDFGTALSGGGNAGFGAVNINTASSVTGMNFNQPKFMAARK